MTSVKTFADEVREIAALQKVRNEVKALLKARVRNVTHPPSGCWRCGLTERLHRDPVTGAPASWHSYGEPDAEQIKTRMLARRYGSAADAQDTNTEK